MLPKNCLPAPIKMFFDPQNSIWIRLEQKIIMRENAPL